MRQRVVITGIGVLSPIGQTLDAFWNSLRDGKSGVRTISAFDTAGLPVHIGGEISDFDARQHVIKDHRKSLKMMARPIQMAVACTNLTLQDAAIDTKKLDPTRFGVAYGSGLIASELDELGPAAKVSTDGRPGYVDMHKWGLEGREAMPPLWLLKYLPNMLACHVSIMHNAQGPNNTITETDVGPLLALGEAARIIERGHADVMLTGGADSKMNPLSLTRNSMFRPLSKRNNEPTKAVRPFERNRDGIVLGEGAGILLLEEREHALKRGGKIYGEVIGFGSTFDLHRNGEGLARAIRIALQQAKVKPEAIDHVNAHGFSSRKEDAWEARGLHLVFGGCKPAIPVFAAKSYFGALGAGSGGIELAASLLAMKHGTLPATLNQDEPDPECPISVAAKPRPIERDFFVKINITELGQCAAVVVKAL